MWVRLAESPRGQAVMDSPSIIERREYKYLIDARTVAQVRAAIAPFCKLDPFAALLLEEKTAAIRLFFRPILFVFPRVSESSHRVAIGFGKEGNRCAR